MREIIVAACIAAAYLISYAAAHAAEGEWQYQLRIDLADEFAPLASVEPQSPKLYPLPDILNRHHATLRSLWGSFVNYVAEAERYGPQNCPLYAWTKATIENPAKKAKHQSTFTLHVEGDEVYAREKADALERDLQPLVGGGIITRLARHDGPLSGGDAAESIAVHRAGRLLRGGILQSRFRAVQLACDLFHFGELVAASSSRSSSATRRVQYASSVVGDAMAMAPK
jgi:hypothetical protein